MRLLSPDLPVLKVPCEAFCKPSSAPSTTAPGLLVCSACWRCLPACGRTMFRRADRPHFAYPFVNRWTFGLFPVFGCREQCCCGHLHSSSRGDIRFQLSGHRPRSGTAGSCDEAGDALHSVVTLCGAHRRLVESNLPQGRARCRPAGSHGLPEQRNVYAGTKLEVPTLPGQALSALD